MAHIEIPHEVPTRHLRRSRGRTLLFGGMALVGLLAFGLGLLFAPDRAWRGYVVAWLYTTSIAMGAIVFTAATIIVKAKWDWSVRRVGMAFAAFLPVSFVLFLPMLGLGDAYFPWIEEMAHDVVIQEKQAYLNMPFLVARNVVGLLALFGLSLYLVYLAVRPDLGLMAEGDLDDGRRRWRDRLTAGWAGQEAEEVRSWQRMKSLTPALVLVYAVVMSIVSFDWIMSLEPHWFSTLFGGWFFMGAFWGGIAAIALTVVLLRPTDEWLGRAMGTQQLHDLGKLAFAFCVFWAYLFWAQYLVIWYGKLPWEQSFVVRRSYGAWGAMSLAVIVLCFVIPFAGLIGRRTKRTPALLGVFAGVILLGLFLERYLLVVPSIFDPAAEGAGPAMHFWEPLIAIGFVGALGLSVSWFLATFPVVQVWTPPVEAEMIEKERSPTYGFSGQPEAYDAAGAVRDADGGSARDAHDRSRRDAHD